VDLTIETQATYLEQLSTCDPTQIETAIHRTIREWDKPSMMPTITFILERCDRVELAAEQAWDLVDRVMRRHWHPDIGFYADAPTFDGPTEYALRIIGGLHKINNTPMDKLTFVRKEFLEAYQRFKREDGAQLKLSQAQAERTLKALTEKRMDFLTKGNPGGQEHLHGGIPRPQETEISPSSHTDR
jgi:hypothetical protein